MDIEQYNKSLRTSDLLFRSSQYVSCYSELTIINDSFEDIITIDNYNRITVIHGQATTTKNYYRHNGSITICKKTTLNPVFDTWQNKELALRANTGSAEAISISMNDLKNHGHIYVKECNLVIAMPEYHEMMHPYSDIKQYEIYTKGVEEVVQNITECSPVFSITANISDIAGKDITHVVVSFMGQFITVPVTHFDGNNEVQIRSYYGTLSKTENKLICTISLDNIWNKNSTYYYDLINNSYVYIGLDKIDIKLIKEKIAKEKGNVFTKLDVEHIKTKIEQETSDKYIKEINKLEQSYLDLKYANRSLSEDIRDLKRDIKEEKRKWVKDSFGKSLTHVLTSIVNAVVFIFKKIFMPAAA